MMHAVARSLPLRPGLVALALNLTLAVTWSHGAGPAAEQGATWPGFRGAAGDGIAAAPAAISGLPRLRLETAWKKPLGSGYSGLAVAEGRLVTLYSDGTSDRALALDADTGAEIWSHTLGPTYAGHDGSHTGPIATPLIAGGQVFVLGPRGVLAALRLDTGAPAWSVDLVEVHGAAAPFYGFATSPLLADGVLLVEGGAKDAAVAAFDPATGELKWTAGSDKISYQSPVPAHVGGRRLVLLAGDAKLAGLDPATGTVLWEYAHEGGGARGAASLVPVPAGEGRIFLAHKDDTSALVSVTRKDETVTVATAWENNAIRNSYNVPVYHDGHLYAFSSRFLTCVDAATGEARWRSREPGDGFLILVDGHLVILTKEGSLHVAPADPSGYREVARTDLFEDLAWTMPSYAGGRIYVRSLGEIARVDLRTGAAPERARAETLQDPAGTRLARDLEAIMAAQDRKAAAERFLEAQKEFPLIEGDRVHFLYAGSGRDLAVAGDLFGARQEEPMTRLPGTDLFYLSVEAEPGLRASYLFIRDFEEIPDPRNPRRVTSTLLGPDMEMGRQPGLEMSWFAMPGWREPDYLREPEDDRRGRLESVELQSAILEGKQTFQVYLPAGYDGAEARYPVLYVHGGTGVLEHGKLPTALDNLIGERVAPLIAVFIDQRTRDTDAYARMLSEELIPHVDATYRTVAAPEARANLGMGFPGYTAVYCTFKQEGVVQKVAGQSVFIMDSMWTRLEPLLPQAKERPLDIYLDWGRYDLRNPHEAWDMAASSRRLAAALEERGFAVAGGEALDGTDWASWRNRTGAVLQALFPLPGSSRP